MLWRQSTISSLRIEIGLDLDRHRRSERRMRHLVFARPLHPDRPAAGRLRQQHGVERDVVGGIVPIAAGAFHMLDRDVLDRQFQNQREIGAEKIDPLAVGPDVDAVLRGPLRHGAGRRDRGMRDIGAGVLPPDRPRRFALVADAVLVSITVGSDGWAFRNEASWSSSGSASPDDHVAPLRNALMAASAPASVSLTTPAKLAVARDGDKAGNGARAILLQGR